MIKITINGNRYTMDDLVLAIEDLWDHIGAKELRQLQGQTKTVAQDVHDELCHDVKDADAH